MTIITLSDTFVVHCLFSCVFDCLSLCVLLLFLVRYTAFPCVWFPCLTLCASPPFTAFAVVPIPPGAFRCLCLQSNGLLLPGRAVTSSCYRNTCKGKSRRFQKARETPEKRLCAAVPCSSSRSRKWWTTSGRTGSPTRSAARSRPGRWWSVTRPPQGHYTAGTQPRAFLSVF